METNVLVINAGSSSDKCILFSMPTAKILWEGLLDWSQVKGKVSLSSTLSNGKKIQKIFICKNREEAFVKLLSSIEQFTIDIIGHRVVHGGIAYSEPTLITPKVIKIIQKLFPLAPLHNPPELESIKILEKYFPKVPQVAVFDTAFHATIPPSNSTYAGPYSWIKSGIKRYGFHGISHAYCAKRAAQLLGKPQQRVNLITCHLGNGCSLTAIQNGKSINTTMGFTPLEGIIMGTRCGSIDPGILLYLLNEKKMKPKDIDHCLYHESGLLGICGQQDMRNVLAAVKKGDERAILAAEMFIHSLRYHICGLAASLKNIDAVVFTGGIGENSAYIRQKACEDLPLGIKLSRNKNLKCETDQEISASDSNSKVLVIHTREELAIAQACMDNLKGDRRKSKRKNAKMPRRKEG